MITIKNAFEEDTYNFTTFASDLQLDCDTRRWPKAFATDLGNGQPFLQTCCMNGNDGAYYIQKNSCIVLTLFND
jgi:hypothetical protein